MSAKTLSKKSELTLEDLVMMVKHGFDDMHKRMNERFQKVDERFDSIDALFERMEKRLSFLEIGQTDILVRLDDVPYRFELVELDQRVTKIEKRLRLKVQ